MKSHSRVHFLRAPPFTHRAMGQGLAPGFLGALMHASTGLMRGPSKVVWGLVTNPRCMDAGRSDGLWGALSPCLTSPPLKLQLSTKFPMSPYRIHSASASGSGISGCAAGISVGRCLSSVLHPLNYISVPAIRYHVPPPNYKAHAGLCCTTEFLYCLVDGRAFFFFFFNNPLLI